MKKNYIQPKMQVVTLKSRVSILTTSTLDVKSQNYMYEGDDDDWEDDDE